ncbi:MAG TPA: EamA family transporter [Rhizomicrobium sp.]|nr:EamA family transporter [Rhizomicrobium sp.]
MSRIGFLNAVLAATLFGVGGTFAQFLFQQRGVDIDWLVTMRLLCAGPVLLLMAAARQGRAIFQIWRDDPVPIILFGLIGMMPVQYTYMAAIDASNTATATVLQFTAPAMIAVWLALVGRRWPDKRELAAIALAMLGTYFLVTHGRLGALSITPLALFWGLASAVAAAFNSIQPAQLLRKYGASLVAGWAMLVGGTALALIHPPWRVQGTWDASAYAFLAFIILFGTLVAFYLYNKALRAIGAQTTSLLTCAEPLSAAVLSVWWLGVSWGGMDWLGTLCILLTIVLLAKEQSEEGQSEKVT